MSNEALFRWLQIITVPIYLASVVVMRGLHGWLRWELLSTLAIVAALAIVMHHVVYAAFSIVCMAAKGRDPARTGFYSGCLVFNVIVVICAAVFGPGWFELLCKSMA